MEEEIAGEIPDILKPYYGTSAHTLSHSTKHYFGKFLDPETSHISAQTSRIQDWRGLAEELGFCSRDINIFRRHESRSPTFAVIEKWLLSTGTGTVGDLLNAFCNIERFDLLNDGDLQNNIGQYTYI